MMEIPQNILKAKKNIFPKLAYIMNSIHFLGFNGIAAHYILSKCTTLEKCIIITMVCTKNSLLKVKVSTAKKKHEKNTYINMKLSLV